MKRLLFTALFLGCSSLVSAQTFVTGSSGITFAASADHNVTVTLATTPPTVVQKLTSYELDVIAQNPLGAIAFTFGLGKPTPDASNNITVKPIANFGGLTDGAYTAVVLAIGPFASLRS